MRFLTAAEFQPHSCGLPCAGNGNWIKPGGDIGSKAIRLAANPNPRMADKIFALNAAHPAQTRDKVTNC